MILLIVAIFIFLIINSFRPVPSKNSQTYSSEQFSLLYPRGTFTARETVISSGGSGVLLKPTNNDMRAQIEVQVKDSSQVPLERLNKIFTGYGLQKQSVVVGPDKIPATQFGGTVLGPSNANKKRATFFEKNGKTYKIQLGYVSEQEIPELNSAYDEVISTFDVKK